MPATLDQVSCGDSFAPSSTIENVFGSSGGFFAISGNDAFVRLQKGLQGVAEFFGEVHVPQGTGTLLAGTTGISFRNYQAGQVAVVTAALYYPAEPPLIVSSLGTVQAVVTTGLVAGIVNNIGGIVGGSGFSVVHSGTGVYAVSFSTPFSARPAVTVTVDQAASLFVFLTGPSTNGFTVNLVNASSSPADAAFDFHAVVPA